MAFRLRATPEPTAETPEKLFPLLPRTNLNSDGLWSQQTDILRDYMQHVGTHDLAVELPTGTGKTLPGLLIAEWRRRRQRVRSVFACPTVQLVKQVVRVAGREGIPVVDLSRGWRSWDQAALRSYEAANATAIVTYSTIFNVHPHISTPDVLLFDDAHAADQYVSGAYTVSISRRDLPSVYEDVIEALRTGLTGERHGQLVMQTPGPGARSNVDLLFPALLDNAEALDHALVRLDALDTSAARQQSFRYSAIRGHLSSCNVYVSWDRIEIRPTVAPTAENDVFTGATQRIYLSATLGSAGELERAFSRPRITRLRLPPEAAKPRSGRRFVVFPHLVTGIDPDEMTKQLLQLNGRAIVLTPSDRAAAVATAKIVPDGWTTLGRDDVVDSFDSFAQSTDTACVLANRYDGIDLPGEACRVVALFGLPRATTLHEEFLATRARASAVLEERLRARVVQGTGRCTRGPRDFALVIVADADTTNYLSRPEVQRSLDEDLQAEVQFGLDQSETTAAELLENVRVFLDRDPEWQSDAEPIIADHRANSSVQPPPESAGLLAAAPHEVRAAEASWTSDWSSAGDQHHQAAEALSSFPAARGYRAYQLFLSSIYQNTAGRVSGDKAKMQAADAAASQAVAAATPATWMRSAMPLPGAQARPLSGADRIAVDTITARLERAGSSVQHNAAVEKMLAGLSAVDHKEYEPALSTLGGYLGADASKPPGDGRPDAVWCWGNELWITLEAKSEHISEGPIGLDDVRESNEHLEFLAADRGADLPESHASVMISPRPVFKRDAGLIAEPFLFRVFPRDMTSLAEAVDQLWLRLRTLRNVTDLAARRNGVSTALAEARLLPEDILDRLTVIPIRSV